MATAFLVVGLRDSLAIFLKLAVAEPNRGMAEEKLTMEVLQSLKNSSIYGQENHSEHLSIACGIHAFVSYGAGNFLPHYFKIA